MPTQRVRIRKQIDSDQQVKPATLALEIRREIYTHNSTLGRLFVNGEFECYALEDRVRAPGVKVAGATCIPAGRYSVAINYSSRFRRRMPLLLEVEGFAGVRIHCGNTHADTEGCILVGQVRNADSVGRSREAFRKLFARLEAANGAGQQIRLTIEYSSPAAAALVSQQRA